MENEARPPLVGGRYELERRIANGGMGQVWSGRDTRLSRPVAVKFLRADLASRAPIRARFEGEARAAAKLSHPNVVAIYDSGTHDGLPFLVMERLSGRTLVDELATGPMDVERVRQVAGQVLDALAAAHTGGIVHRDIKPGNVLLTEEGTAKVADFGIAKLMDSAATETREVLGTVAYMAPERFEGQPATPRSDLYSVGAVLYQALTGRVPFEGDVFGVADAIRAGRRPAVRELRPDADRDLAEAVERALVPDPAQRFGSAEEMAAAIRGEAVPAETTEPLVTAAGGPVTPTRPLTVSEPAVAGRRVPRSVLAAIGVLAVVAGIVLALVVGGLFGEPSPPPPADERQAETSDLPPPLEEALDDLDEAVRP